MNRDNSQELIKLIDKYMERCDGYVASAKAIKLSADTILREMSNFKAELADLKESVAQREYEIISEPVRASEPEPEEAQKPLPKSDKNPILCEACGSKEFVPKKRRSLFRRKTDDLVIYYCKHCGAPSWAYTEYITKKKDEDVDDTWSSVPEETDDAQPSVEQVVEQKNVSSIPVSQLDSARIKWNGITLNDEQTNIVRLLETTGGNYFITGKAGCGKSTVLKCFCDITSKRIAVLAPTGIAAMNVGGQTIHSFFKMGISPQDVRNMNDVYNVGGDDHLQVFKDLDMLIIDEISMVRVDIMDMIDAKMRVARKCNAPFGGCQVVVFGDLYQLQPIVAHLPVGDFLMSRYNTVFFFGAPAAKTFKMISLEKVFRQVDNTFLNILNNIRSGEITLSDLTVLNTRSGSAFVEDESVTLVPTKIAEKRINEEQLARVNSELYTYPAIVEGTVTEDDVPVVQTLSLKVNARVILLANDIERRYANGTIGHVESLSPDLITVRVKGRQSFSVERKTWPKFEYRYNKETDKVEQVPVGSFTQFPLKLAYAITIHKSQGQTFDDAVVDYSVGGAFAPGMTYVALSRCRTLEHLKIPVPIEMKDIQRSQEVVEYMKNVKTVNPKTALRENAFEELPF